MELGLSALSDANILEAAQYILSKNTTGVTAEEMVHEILQSADLSPVDFADLNSAVHATADGHQNDTVSLLRLQLAALLNSDSEQKSIATTSLAQVGRKQIVVGPSEALIGIGLAVFLLILATGGRKNKSVEIEYSWDEKGRRKVRYQNKVEYIDPLSPVNKIIGYFEGGDSASGTSELKTSDPE